MIKNDTDIREYELVGKPQFFNTQDKSIGKHNNMKNVYAHVIYLHAMSFFYLNACYS